MPLPTRPFQPSPEAVLRASLTPPPGAVTTAGLALTAGGVRTSVGLFGYSEGHVEYFVDGALAARRTFNLGHSSGPHDAAPVFFEGIANAFDVEPDFRRQGIARLLHRHLTASLVDAGVDRILVKADRDGSAVWQRFYDWDFEAVDENSQFLRSAVFDRRIKLPLVASEQRRWRVRAVQSARRNIPGLPLAMRLLPWLTRMEDYDAQERVARYLIGAHRIKEFAKMEGEPGSSALLSSINWHGVLCLSARATAHNERLRQEVLVALRSPGR